MATFVIHPKGCKDVIVIMNVLQDYDGAINVLEQFYSFSRNVTTRTVMINAYLCVASVTLACPRLSVLISVKQDHLYCGDGIAEAFGPRVLQH